MGRRERSRPIEFAVFILVVIVGVIATIFGHKAAKARREALALAATELGLRFDPRHDTTHDELYAHFELFRRGFGRSAYNTLSGRIDVGGRALDVRTGDFKYKTREGSGKNRRTVTHRFSYFILHLPFETMPDLLIRREGFFDKIGDVFGFDDIDFESAEFSRKYFVRSPNKKFAYDVCHQRMIEFLLETSPSSVDIERSRMCMTDGARVWRPEAFAYTIGWAGEFLSRWPDFVVKDLQQGRLT